MLAKAYIEITTFCGLSCDFCEPTKSPSKQMDFSLFEKINKELAGKTKSIAYHILGDPLTADNLQTYLDISAFYNHKVELTTSGRYLGNIDKTLLTHKAVRQINFSLSSFFANKNFGLEFDEYMRNIMDFCMFSAKIPKRFVNLRLWNIGNDKYLSFNADVEKMLEKEFTKPLYVNQKARIAPYTMVVKDKMFDWPSPQKSVLSAKGSCHAISSQLGFLVDGRVVPCCLDTKGHILLGDIKNQTLHEIINSNKAVSMVNGFRDDILIESMCQACGFREARL